MTADIRKFSADNGTYPALGYLYFNELLQVEIKMIVFWDAGAVYSGRNWLTFVSQKLTICIIRAMITVVEEFSGQR